jgi:hypothetical protein
MEKTSTSIYLIQWPLNHFLCGILRNSIFSNGAKYRNQVTIKLHQLCQLSIFQSFDLSKLSTIMKFTALVVMLASAVLVSSEDAAPMGTMGVGLSRTKSCPVNWYQVDCLFYSVEGGLALSPMSHDTAAPAQLKRRSRGDGSGPPPYREMGTQEGCPSWATEAHCASYYADENGSTLR